MTMYGKLMLGAARQAPVKSLLSRSSLNQKVVARFVAGEDVDTALQAIRPLVEGGLRVSLDFLGEDITDVSQAEETVGAYRTIVSRLAEVGLADGAEVSAKLSALGQSLGPDGPRQSTERAFALVQHAESHGVDVTFDMEDHSTIDSTLESVRALRQEFPRVGCVLQTMLFRTEADARDLATPGSRVRLVKGAYAEPPSVAHSRKAQVDQAYVRCLRTLVDGGAYPMVATHDSRLMDIAADLFGKTNGAEATGEFQMLYGIRPAEQRRRVDAGHTVRVYVPFGTDWYAYFTRRLAERPANLAFFAKSLLSR
jgi:proline dehydrogenase